MGNVNGSLPPASTGPAELLFHYSSEKTRSSFQQSADVLDRPVGNSHTSIEESVLALDRLFTSIASGSSQSASDAVEEATKKTAHIYEKYLEEKAKEFSEQGTDTLEDKKKQFYPDIIEKLKNKYCKSRDESLAEYEKRIAERVVLLAQPDAFQSTFLSKLLPEQAQTELAIELLQDGKDIVQLVGQYGELGLFTQKIALQELKVHLVINHLVGSHGFFGRVMQSLSRSFEWRPYGSIHTALQIGPFIIDWTSSSLVHPYYAISNDLAFINLTDVELKTKPVYGFDAGIPEMALLATDIVETTTGYSLGTIDDDKLKTVAEFCTHWNQSKTYDSMKNNCQHFVDALMNELGLDPKSLEGTAYHRFLKNIRKSDRTMLWEERQNGKVLKEHKFESHSEIDLLLHDLHQDEAKWNSLDMDCKMLLKCYHGSYLGRYFSHLFGWSGNAANSTSKAESFVTFLPSMTCKCFKLAKRNHDTLDINPVHSMNDLVKLVSFFSVFSLDVKSTLSINRHYARERMRKREANNCGIRILALDGGGVRALVQGLCLSHLQHKGLESIIGSFDMICGTSAGGLIALYIVYGAGRFPDAQEQPPAENTHRTPGTHKHDIPPPAHQADAPLILQMAVTLPEKIFGKGNTSTKRFIKYLTDRKGMVDPARLEHELSAAFRGATMCETDAPKCFVVTTECRGADHIKHRTCILANFATLAADKTGHEERVFSTGFTTVAAAGRMTASAPLVFPDVNHDKHIHYNDGGLLENCPITVAYHQARAIWPGRRIDAIVSLGTGRMSNEVTKESKIKKFLRRILGKHVVNVFKVLMDLATNSHRIYQDFEKNNRFYDSKVEHLLRLDVELDKEIHLFDSGDETVAELRRASKKMLKQNETKIQEMVRLLNADRRTNVSNVVIGQEFTPLRETAPDVSEITEPSVRLYPDHVTFTTGSVGFRVMKDAG